MNESRGLIGLIGLYVQLGGCLLLAALFLLLRRHSGRRRYFTYWTMAWVVVSAAVGMLMVRSHLKPHAGVPGLADESVQVRLLYGAYQSAKLIFLALCFAGTATFASGVRLHRFVTYAAVLAIAYAAMSVIVATSLSHIVLLQCLVAIPTFVGCASALLLLRPSRRSVGSRMSASVFGGMAALWALYAVSFGWSYVFAGPRPAFLIWVPTLNTYLDLLLQMLLGYGMVVMLLEDAKREVDAAHAELAVAHDALRRATLYDVLTGALNRRAFEEGVGLEGARGNFGAVAMVDLDNLKAVNDTHGHAAGDQLLRHLVAVLRDQLGARDRLYRWGGDEFLVVLPGTKAQEASERLQQAIQQSPPLLTTSASQPVYATASVGAAGFAGAEDVSTAIERADAEMYIRKQKRKTPPPVRALG
jgi:diguanylate cyclase (GGDEF)-like protein